MGFSLMYKYCFINYDKCTTVVYTVSQKGTGYEAHGNSSQSSQLFCKSKTSLKFKKKCLLGEIQLGSTGIPLLYKEKWIAANQPLSNLPKTVVHMWQGLCLKLSNLVSESELLIKVPWAFWSILYSFQSSSCSWKQTLYFPCLFQAALTNTERWCCLEGVEQREHTVCFFFKSPSQSGHVPGV